ncbi:MAG: ATP-binding protein [Termitinemataceae bacterium]|nr:MAG: ATP-binding protein [Termitinemataceae bacterium]
MKRKLPIGIQDFVSIRQDGFIYVDKTVLIHSLISGSGRVFFLSRPRRFGKSLLCSTLAAIFEGRRELFAAFDDQSALAIDSLDWEWKKHPVIRIDLSPGDYTTGTEVLTSIVRNDLENTAVNADLKLRGDILPIQFSNLIMDMHRKYGEKVVVLIDEYDKPMLSTIDNKDLCAAMRNVLKGFYSVLKSSDEHQRFVLLTGVTKFSQVSVFSGLNNLIDISLDARYADICGITQKELQRDFKPEIKKIVQASGANKKEYLDRLRRYYNGYRFSEKELTVYNPYGMLNHFYMNGKFLPYWFETGTPSFLIKLIEEQHINILELSNMRVGYDDFQKYDVENMSAVPVLYQTGYLTITGYDDAQKRFMLDYPNEEVRSAFAKSLFEMYLNVVPDKRNALSIELVESLFFGKTEDAINTLIPFFASIPYDLSAGNENYYQTVVHLLFTMLGLRCRSEVRIAAGRIDTLVECGDYVYCFEFKVGGTADEALRQIDSKEYLLPWRGEGKKLIKVGVVFDTEKRNIGEWKQVVNNET